MDGDVLAMATMIFADEVVDPERIDDARRRAEDVEVNDRELAMAKQLIDSLAGEFEPEKYHDTYREEVLALIERKAAGEEIAVQPAERGGRGAGARPHGRARRRASTRSASATAAAEGDDDGDTASRSPSARRPRSARRRRKKAAAKS